jgi:hypothetical protein
MESCIMAKSPGVFLVLLLVSATAPAAERVDYLRDVKPILKARCYACHGALKQKSRLRVDTAERILKGGRRGPAVVPGKPEKSRLIQRVSSDDFTERMPPEGKPLSAKEIALLRAWVAQVPVAIAGEKPQEDPRDHWAFRPPVRPPLPRVAGLEGGNPIDLFLAREHRARGLVPLPLADRRTLLRRVYLDLIGLPPTRAELRAFLADDSPDAYEKAVDRLLASPRYGERWGRHWMDVWRYSDWYGLGAQLRNSQKHIWHWRDWIIESLNADKGYDRMVLEMLAADEVAPTDPDALRATGFLARNYYLFNRTTWLDSTIEHTSKAFLGLTLQCARCHDHKYDPITQKDYYRFRALFEPHQVRLDSVPGETDLEKDGLPRVFDAHPDAPTYLFIRGNEKDPDKSQPIEPGVPAFLEGDGFVVKPVSLPPEAHAPALRPFVLRDGLRKAQAEIAAAERALAAAREQEAVALKKASAKPSPAGAEKSAGALFLSDPFDKPLPEVWEMKDGKWEYRGGKLLQTRTGPMRASLFSRKDHPRDFRARFRFTITGGEKWKSVGLCFDVAGGREKLVYLSATAGGPKLQIAYNTGAGATYPPAGAQRRPVKLGTPYELTVSVRDTLVNVAVNGEHALAYRLPVKREPGKLSLIAFDAAAAFDSLEVHTLPADAKLVDVGGKSVGTVGLAEARANVAIVEKALEAARLRPAVLRSIHEAEAARHSPASKEEKTALFRKAASAEARYQFLKAEERVLQAKKQVDHPPPKVKGSPAKGLEQARAALEQARKRLADPGENYTRPRASLKALEGPAESAASRNSPYPAVSTGRRTALARWLIADDNPLTSRVAVNHIWMRHFGKPLVEPVTDFGLRTKEPALRELLDWLAVEFREGGYRMKHLHRLIVTSRAYRRSGVTVGADSATVKADPENRFYWRRDPVRMESEVIRDAMLHLAGALDPHIGGPTIDPKKADTAYRRSLYFAHSRDDVHPFLTMFDDADILACYRRGESIVPQQALTLANSKLSLDMARRLAGRLQTQLGEVSDGAFVDAAWEAVLCTRPTAEERSACLDALAQMKTILAGRKHADPVGQARANLVHALFNHNDFITVR